LLAKTSFCAPSCLLVMKSPSWLCQSWQLEQIEQTFGCTMMSALSDWKTCWRALHSKCHTALYGHSPPWIASLTMNRNTAFSIHHTIVVNLFAVKHYKKTLHLESTFYCDGASIPFLPPTLNPVEPLTRPWVLWLVLPYKKHPS
jgi:hypothetical protein